MAYQQHIGMRVDFLYAPIGAGVFMDRMMPMVSVPMMYLFVEKTNAAAPIKLVP
jgi:hypothetical protein